jgi:rod shape-determining protein MreC
MSASADVQNGDLLVTSGLDGTYPAGLPVAVVNRIERNADTPFARIFGTPVAGVDSSRHLLIVAPAESVPPRPEEENPENQARTRRSKRGG